MNKKSDQIKSEIAHTKAELGQKLEQLEGLVREDLSDVKEGVEGVIDNVKSTVKSFSLTHQVQQRPLLMAGGSMLTGLVFTRWLMGGQGPRRATISGPDYATSRGPSLMSSVADRYPDEVRVLKTMAFSFLVNLVAEKAKEGLPHLVESIGAIERRLKEEIAARK